MNWLKITVTAMTWPQVTNQLSPERTNTQPGDPAPYFTTTWTPELSWACGIRRCKVCKDDQHRRNGYCRNHTGNKFFLSLCFDKVFKKFCYPNEWSKDRAWSDSAANLWLDIDPMDNGKCCSSTTPGGDLNHQCPPWWKWKLYKSTSMVELTELVQPSGVWPFDRLFAEVPFQRHGLYSDLVLGIGAGCHSPLSL